MSPMSPNRIPREELDAPVQVIYLRIRNALLRPIPTPANPNPVANPNAHGHFYLIAGTYQDIQRYAGTTVDWIIEVAQRICDPLGGGDLYTHTTGAPPDWYSQDRTSIWQRMVQGDPLRPGIYEFEPSTGPILLSKISERETHSVTSLGSASNATTFGKHVRQREGQACAVTRMPMQLVATHLIPKRMGTSGAREVITRFSGPQEAAGIDVYDPRIGILLFATLDGLVDHYQLGFYHVTGNEYILHNFTDYPDISLLGAPRLPDLRASDIPDVHLHHVTLQAYDNIASLPPPGAFNWHYLQCVIRMFGTSQYKDLPNIKHFVYPFKTAADISGDEYEVDDETDPPYPSYRFDRYLAEQGKRQMALERHEEMVKWSSGILSGI